VIYSAKSTDRKPTEAVTGDVLIQTDTGILYTRDERRWIPVGSPVYPSLRYVIGANVWKQLTFPGTHAVIPNYDIKCRSTATPVHDVQFYIKNESVTGLEIKADEACKIQFTVYPINAEITL